MREGISIDELISAAARMSKADDSVWLSRADLKALREHCHDLNSEDQSSFMGLRIVLVEEASPLRRQTFNTAAVKALAFPCIGHEAERLSDLALYGNHYCEDGVRIDPERIGRKRGEMTKKELGFVFLPALLIAALLWYAANINSARERFQIPRPFRRADPSQRRCVHYAKALLKSAEAIRITR